LLLVVQNRSLGLSPGSHIFLLMRLQMAPEVEKRVMSQTLNYWATPAQKVTYCL
jgi:hypothetical protein